MAYTEKMRESHRKHPMRRRDYELIAYVIKESKHVEGDGLAEDFTDELGKMPGFDRERFLKACGV